MWQRIVNKEVHLWLVFLVFIAIVTGGILWNQHHPFLQTNYNLTITRPDGTKEALAYGTSPELQNPDFYASTRDSLVKEKASFIEANLSTMKIRVYKDGLVVKEADILTKGKKGSWWETPAGVYRVEDKVRKHLSSFSPVYTEWNLIFQGNFFIHGWPYWADSGEPVTSTYSGGCIRLSDKDAEEIYGEATVGEPVLVFEDSSDTTPHDYAPNLSNVNATSFLAADIENSYVFLEKNTSDKLPLASSVDLLDALVATDYMNIEHNISSSGHTYTLYDLLFPLLLKNDENVADDILSPLGSTRALGLMNDKATAIGMVDTHVGSVEVDDSDNVTTAEDLFRLGGYLYNYRRFILNLTNKVVDNASYGKSAFGGIPNTSPFKNIPGYVGGTTSASSTVAVFNVTFGDSKRPIAFIALGSSDPAGDISAMLDYVESAYK